MNFLKIHSLYPEQKGFTINRHDLGKTAIFCHFLTPVSVYFGKTEVKLRSGACIFWDLHAHQHFSCNECDMLHNWFHADDSIHAMMQKYGLNYETVYYPLNNDAITQIFQHINAELTQKSPFYREATDALAERFFVEIARADETEKISPGIDSEQKALFFEARSQIHMDIHNNWTTEAMAKLVNMSPSRFYSLYQKYFGISPHKDLIQRRIQAAQMLLECEDATVAKIAEQTGYTNQYHFIRQFKQITGKTPGQIKAKNKQG